MEKVIDLSDFIMTHSQANDFTLRLNSIIEQMYTTNYNFEKVVKEQLGVEKADAFFKMLRENGLQNATIPQIQEFLKKIQTIVTNLSVVSLTLAFEPSEEVLKTFAQWFITNINTQVIFDVRVDHNIIGGIKITYNGKFKDYSLGTLFEKLLQSVLSPQPKESTPHQNEQLITIGR